MVMDEIKEYIKKILELGINLEEGDALIIYIPNELSEIEKIFLELKDEYKIKDIIFIKVDFARISSFLKKKPSYEEMYNFSPQYNSIRSPKRIKVIKFLSALECNPYYKKLVGTQATLFGAYRKIFEFKNIELSRQIERSPEILVTCPNSFWAKDLFGSGKEIDKLWSLVTRTVPTMEEAKRLIEDLEEKTKILNDMQIADLNIKTESGTDLTVSLSPASVWINAFCNSKNGGIALNFPSYEICTSPNMCTTTGKAVLTRPVHYNGIKIKNAELEFKDGRIIRCSTPSKAWVDLITNAKNRLNYIGEVALVSSDSPIAQLDGSFGEIQLDENTGCHIALGDSLEECIDPKRFNMLPEEDKDCFFSSSHHQDLPIGDSGTTVEIKSPRYGRKLILTNGRWNL